MSLIENLDSRYSEVFRNQVKDLIINGGLAILYLASLGAIVTAIGLAFSEGDLLHIFLSMTAFAVFIVMIKKLHPYEKKYTPLNHQFTFKRFYKYSKKLNDFDPDDEKKIKSITNATEFLAFYINGWTDPKAPSAVQVIPKSISETLKNDVVKLLKSKDKEKIKKFLKYFLDICFLISRHELTHPQWIIIAKNFIHLSTGKPLEVIEIEETLIPTQYLETQKTPSIVFSIPKYLKDPRISGVLVWISLFTVKVFVDGTSIGSAAVDSTLAATAVASVMIGALILTQKWKIDLSFRKLS